MITISRHFILGIGAIGLGAAILQAQPATPAAIPSPAPAPAAAPEVTGNPKIQFATNIYDFGKARSGEPVKYTYEFTNVGDGVLEINNVQPQCGCTTAGDFTRKVEPGQTGKIPIQFNTGAYNGQVFKTVTVTCNDKSQATVVLQLKGVVWKPVETIPQYAFLNVPPDGQNASITVQVTNHLDEPLNLFDPESSSKSVSVDLKTNELGKSYQLVLTTVPPLNTGNASGKVTLKSTSTNMPTLDIQFYMNVLPAISILPPQVYLQPAPLAMAASPTINIQNVSTNPVTLSEPTVSIPGVEVQIKEVNPGHAFAVQFSFPTGFEIPPGQQAVFTAKCSNPQYPLIKIPIMQAPRPAMAPMPRPASTPMPPLPKDGRAALLPTTLPAPTVK